MADEPVLLTETTGWGVRLTLNRPSKLNALSAELIDAPDSRDRRSRRRRPRPRHRHRRSRSGVLRRL